MKLEFTDFDSEFEMQQTTIHEISCPNTSPKSKIFRSVKMISIESANRILREKLDKIAVETHGYRFSRMSNGSLWVEGPHGDGMEMNKTSLDNMWKEFM